MLKNKIFRLQELFEFAKKNILNRIHFFFLILSIKMSRVDIIDKKKLFESIEAYNFTEAEYLSQVINLQQI